MKVNAPINTVEVQSFTAMVARLAPLPNEDLLRFWLGCETLLALRLKTLNYRPARIVYPIGTSSQLNAAVMNLISDGLVVAPQPEDGTDDPTLVDLVIMSGTSPADEEEVKRISGRGVVVVALVIEEDEKKFAETKNVLAFSGNKYSTLEIERFLRDTLFQMRSRLYCGPPQ